MTPNCYNIMTADEKDAQEIKCRIGAYKNGNPFSGVTAVSDFCAHAHRDNNNLINGCTAILTLLKPEHRDLQGKADDEQLHVLPHYAIDCTDPETGSKEKHLEKVNEGSIEVVKKFERKQILRSEPIRKCKRGGNYGHPEGQRKVFLDNFAKIAKQTNDMEAAVRQAKEIADSTPVARKQELHKRNLKQASLSNGYSKPCDIKCRHVHAKCDKPKDTTTSTSTNDKPVVQTKSKVLKNNDHKQKMVATKPVMFMNVDDEFMKECVDNLSVLANESKSQQSNVPIQEDNFKAKPPTNDSAIGSDLEVESDNEFDDLIQTMDNSLKPNVEPKIEPVVEKQQPSTAVLKPVTQNLPKELNDEFYESDGSNTSSLDISTQCNPPSDSGLSEDNTTIGSTDPESVNDYDIIESEELENLTNKKVGGLAIALTHGSIMWEVARQELHATTALKNPNRFHPTRIGIVFYQHRYVTLSNESAQNTIICLILGIFF